MNFFFFLKLGQVKLNFEDKFEWNLDVHLRGPTKEAQWAFFFLGIKCNDDCSSHGWSSTAQGEG